MRNFGDGLTIMEQQILAHRTLIPCVDVGECAWESVSRTEGFGLWLHARGSMSKHLEQLTQTITTTLLKMPRNDPRNSCLGLEHILDGGSRGNVRVGI